MSHGLICYDPDGKATLDTESGSLSAIHETHACTFTSTTLSFTFTVAGFDHTMKGHYAMVVSSAGYAGMFKVEYPAVGQVKVSGANGYSCTLLVFIA